MSAHMKKHPTNGKTEPSMLYVVDNDNVYAIPRKVAKQYRLDVKKAIHREGNVSAEEIFDQWDQQTGKASALLKGLRSRENLTQVEFANKIGVTQANLSKMEHGTRPIGKKIAKRIADAFSTNYRYFLE